MRTRSALDSGACTVISKDRYKDIPAAIRACLDASEASTNP